jgi:hypothetical protein
VSVSHLSKKSRWAGWDSDQNGGGARAVWGSHRDRRSDVTEKFLVLSYGGLMQVSPVKADFSEARLLPSPSAPLFDMHIG